MFKKLEQIATQPELLKSILDSVNSKVRDIKRPIEEQQEYIIGQLSKNESNIKKFISFIERTDAPLPSMVDKVHALENNAGNSPDQRSVKDIELFFDASLREEFVAYLWYDSTYRVYC